MEDPPTEAPYDPAAAAAASAAASAGRGRGRGRGRGGGGIAIAGIAELDASMGRGAPPLSGGGDGGGPPGPGIGRGGGGAGGGKPFPAKKGMEKDFRGPEGLFKKGDWTCTACGNVNWERRTTCNKCQNQKPNVITTDEVIAAPAGLLLLFGLSILARSHLMRFEFWACLI